jgi:hypothetical protein
MKTKIELGKSVSDKVMRSVENSVWILVSRSVHSSVGTLFEDSLYFSLWEPINNLTDWEITL